MKSKLAITSFIFGVISLLFLIPRFGDLQIPIIISLIILLSPLIGLITGIFSLVIIKKEGVDGRGFAILGIVFSVIGLVFIIWFILAFSAFMRSWF